MDRDKDPLLFFPESFKKAACFDFFLRLCSESDALIIEALKARIKELTVKEIEENELPKKTNTLTHSRITKALPPRLKKKLLGELCLFFSSDFPLIQARINEIDRHISSIVTHLIFLLENLYNLPENIRKSVLEKITCGDKELQQNLFSVLEKADKEYYSWIKIAMDIVQKKLDRISQILEKREI